MIGSLESLSELWLDGNLLNSLPDVRRERGGGGGGGGGGVKEVIFSSYIKTRNSTKSESFPLKGSVMHYMVYVYTYIIQMDPAKVKTTISVYPV